MSGGFNQQGCPCCGVVICPHCEVGHTPNTIAFSPSGIVKLEDCCPTGSTSHKTTVFYVTGGVAYRDGDCHWMAGCGSATVQFFTDPACTIPDEDTSANGEIEQPLFIDIKRHSGFYSVEILCGSFSGNLFPHIFEGTLFEDDCLTSGTVDNTISPGCGGDSIGGGGTITLTPIP